MKQFIFSSIMLLSSLIALSISSSQSFGEVDASQEYVFLRQVLSTKENVDLGATGFEFAISQTSKKRLACNTP
jgi:hypothetical protein